MRCRPLQGIARRSPAAALLPHGTIPEEHPTIFYPRGQDSQRAAWCRRRRDSTPESTLSAHVSKGSMRCRRCTDIAATTTEKSAALGGDHSASKRRRRRSAPIRCSRAGRPALGTAACGFTLRSHPAAWGADWVSLGGISRVRQAVMTDILCACTEERPPAHVVLHLGQAREVISSRGISLPDTCSSNPSPDSGPHDRKRDHPAADRSPRARYQATVPLAVAAVTRCWRWERRATGPTGRREGSSFPISPEYLRFRSNPIVSREIAEQDRRNRPRPRTRAGGRNLSHAPQAQAKARGRIFDWFLAAFCSASFHPRERCRSSHSDRPLFRLRTAVRPRPPQAGADRRRWARCLSAKNGRTRFRVASGFAFRFPRRTARSDHAQPIQASPKTPRRRSCARKWQRPHHSRRQPHRISWP